MSAGSILAIFRTMQIYKKTNCTVNISTNINKTLSTHLKPLNTKRPWRHMALGIQVLDWDRHKNVAGLNHSMGS